MMKHYFYSAAMSGLVLTLPISAAIKTEDSEITVIDLAEDGSEITDEQESPNEEKTTQDKSKKSVPQNIAELLREQKELNRQSSKLSQAFKENIEEVFDNVFRSSALESMRKKLHRPEKVDAGEHIEIVYHIGDFTSEQIKVTTRPDGYYHYLHVAILDKEDASKRIWNTVPELLGYANSADISWSIRDEDSKTLVIKVPKLAISGVQEVHEEA